MPPKSSSSKEKDLTDEDEVLQAVILADSFNKRFKPLTSGKPRCLLPVCNATLLDWTFESLALAGVQEIFVVCRSYPELVKAAIRDSKWSKPSLGLKIVSIITSKETFTPGDAMRDIYTRGIITSDFVLVMGDLVSNIRIDEVVRVHKERRRTNKDAIMTMVVKPSGVVHRTRSKGESAIFVLDAETSECLHYEHVTGYPPKKHAKIPREILAEHPEIEIRNDLIDCGIDVCSVEVPSLFQDNFDYGDIRRDFVHGVLTSDLLMKSIHCYVAREGYAARVADTRSYDSVSKDILARWTFPLVPDDNHPGGHSYEHIRGNKYLAKGNSVVLSRTCKVGSNCLIGAGTHIADNANIQASVIGQRCTIEANVTLRNVYVFDDAHIGAGSVIEYSIVGSNVKVGEGSTVARGCLIGDDVILGKNAKLGEFERVSRRRDEGEADESDKEDEDEQSEDSELEEAEARQDSESITAIIGEGSNAIVWPKGPRADEEDLDEVERYNNQRLMRIEIPIGDPASDLPLEYEGTESDSDASERESDESDLEMHALSRISSATSTSAISTSTPGLNIHTLHDAAAYSEFQAEVTQSLDRAFAEGHSVDNAAVELKTLRMASNVPLRKVREAVVASIVERIEVVEGDAAAQRREISKMVGRWGPLIDKIGGVDPVETIEVLQYHCAKSARLPLFGQILAALYQDDIVEEDDIRAWHARPEAKGEGLKDTSFAENVKRCWLVGTKMIEQFNEQESSEEESGEEDSDEEEQPSKKPAAATAQAAVGKKEESSEEESSSGDDESGEDDSQDSEDDAPATKAATAAPSQPSKPASTPASTKESEEEESEGSEEEESEDDALAPSQPAASKPSASSTTPAVSAAPSAPPPVPAAHAPALVSSTAAPAQPSTQDEESSEEESESEASDKEPAQTAQSQAPPAVASSKQPVTAPSKAESEESEGSEDSEEEEESEDDAASRATEPVPQAQVSTPKASTETARPPATITTQTESVATIPAAVPRPRPGPDVVGGKQNPVVASGSGQVASEGATTSRATTATATSSVATTQHSLRGQSAQERDDDGGEGEESGDDSGETDEEGNTDDSEEE
ncbi:unnamed protein product [Somion occarium]|uniref:Translation initiation factor eIF2B subunit epsilon n=1 Tax=Somion occarium TaxID=3059160 RepID=A0ABP1DCP5_9APHY